jgi:hypothetical protein
MGTSPRRSLAALAAAAILLAARGAAAEGTQHVLYISRPLTLPKFVLVPEVSTTIDQLSSYTISSLNLMLKKSVLVSGSIAVRFGITEDIEMGAVVAPVNFLPSVTYGNPSIYGKFRFIRKTCEVAGYINTTFVTAPSQDPNLYLPVLASKAGAMFEPGLLFRVHAADVAKVDFGVVSPIQVGSVANGVGVRVPIEVAFSVWEQLFLGARTGFGVVNFINDPSLQSSYIPLGLFVGYIIADSEPRLDLQGGFTWPKLTTPGAARKLDYGDYQIGITASVYFYLF